MGPKAKSFHKLALMGLRPTAENSAWRLPDLVVDHTSNARGEFVPARLGLLESSQGLLVRVVLRDSGPELQSCLG